MTALFVLLAVLWVIQFGLYIDLRRGYNRLRITLQEFVTEIVKANGS